MTADEIRALMARKVSAAVLRESIREERIALRTLWLLEQRGTIRKLLDE